MTQMIADTKFGVGDIVRFIGTDKHLTVKQCRTELRLYQVQRDSDETNLEWVLEIYLELVKPASAEASRMIDATSASFVVDALSRLALHFA
jgi:hypothetical protein